jgi:hypothetical protein
MTNAIHLLQKHRIRKPLSLLRGTLLKACSEASVPGMGSAPKKSPMPGHFLSPG